MNNLIVKLATKYKLYSNANVDFDKSKIDQNAILICKKLQNAGFKAYLVGGCVRDLFMGTIPKDWDIATNASPKQSKALFDKTFDSGIEHGTITAILNNEHYEITTFRTEGEYSDGRRPDSVSFVNDIEDDLSRRDLTINAMAYDPINDKIIDPFNGVQDLKNKIIKAVGDPNKRFSEDGLRTMRVARFAARFGFDVEDRTKAAIANNLDVLSKVSKERMRDELTKTLMTSVPSVGLNILKETGALALLGNFDSKTFNQIDRCKGSLETKVAILLHTNPSKVESILRDLKFSNQDSKKIAFLIVAEKEFNKFLSNQNAIEARKFLAFVKSASTDFDKSLNEFFKYCDAIGISTNSFKTYLNEPVIQLKDLKLSTPELIKELDLKGHDIKRVLNILYSKVLEDPSLNTRETLLGLAKRVKNS